MSEIISAVWELAQGANELSVDLGLLANGLYSLSVEGSNGQLKKVVQVLKQ